MMSTSNALILMPIIGSSLTLKNSTDAAKGFLDSMRFSYSTITVFVSFNISAGVLS